MWKVAFRAILAFTVAQLVLSEVTASPTPAPTKAPAPAVVTISMSNGNLDCKVQGHAHRTSSGGLIGHSDNSNVLMGLIVVIFIGLAVIVPFKKDNARTMHFQTLTNEDIGGRSTTPTVTKDTRRTSVRMV